MATHLGNTDPFKFAGLLETKKESFKFSVGSASARIDHRGKVYIFGNKWKKATFGLFSQTKSHLKTQNIPENPKKPIKYIGVLPPNDPFCVYDNIFGIDISGAYHAAALKLGYFTQELKDKHINSGKMERLQAFGATAKNSQEFVYEKGELIEVNRVKSELRPFFMTCAYYVGEALEDCRDELGEDFLFFWVDCVFFKKTEENIKKVNAIFAKLGFEAKEDKTDFVIFRTFKKHYEIERSTGKVVKSYKFSRNNDRERNRDKHAKNIINKLK